MGSRLQRLNRTPRLRPGIQHSLTISETRRPALNRRAVPEIEILTDAVEGPAEVAQTSEETSNAGKWAAVIIITSTIIWGIGAAAGFQLALSLQMGLAILLALAGIFSPALGLLAIAVLAGLDAMAGELLLVGGLLRYNTLNYLLILVALLSVPLILRMRDLPSRVLLIFLMLLTLELTFSQNIESGIQDVLNVAATFGIVVYFARALQDEHTLYWLGVVNGFVAGLGGLVYMTQFSSLPYANPNNWTFWQLTALFSICISFPYARKLNKSRLLLIILAVVNLAWIFLSASRGSLLIAALCMLYLFLSTRSITWSSVLIGAGALAFTLLSAQFVEQQSYTVSRIQLLFNPDVSESKRTSQRSELIKAGWELFLDNPMGIGTGSFREAVAETALFETNRPAHSAWVKTLAENGVPGILLQTLFVASFAIIGLRKPQDGRLLLGLFVTAVFATGFVAKGFQGKSLWFLAAAGIVLLNAESMLGFVNQKLKPFAVNRAAQLREIRFGHKKR